MSDDVSPLTDDTPAERTRARPPHCRCQCFRLTTEAQVVLADRHLHTEARCGLFERLSCVWSADGKDFTIAVVWRPA